jgi:twitching motility protein PilT
MRAAVRQDPDVMLVGEMRDHVTFETALIAAETGHLVFGTIHSSGCAQTLGRILDLFTPDRHAQIRKGLAFNLRCIMNQKLLRGCTEQRPRVPCLEFMFITPIIRKLILDAEDNKIQDAIKVDIDNGCESYNQSLARLYHAKLISEEVALRAAPNAEELRMQMRGISISDAAAGIV